MTILVIGARGNIGSALVQELLDVGEHVRASSRTPETADFPGGVEVVRGDLTDPSTFPGLVAGVRKAFLYANAEQARIFTAAAREAGVEHIVLLSSNSILFPNPRANPVTLEHLQVEEALQASGVDWTFVRPGYLATNSLRWQNVIRTERTVRTAFPDGATPLVHEKDVAAVAAQALLDDRHRGKAYLVLGGATLTEREQVATIAEALGEPVRFDVVDVESYRTELLTQIPEFYVDALIHTKGQVPQVPEDVRIDAVPEVLGRPALTYAEWTRDHVADFR